MSWTSIITGGMSVIIAYAMFTTECEEEMEVKIEPESNLVVNGVSGRTVMMSCQTCRKLKRHKEVEPDLYVCTKCKRLIDLRRAS